MSAQAHRTPAADEQVATPAPANTPWYDPRGWLDSDEPAQKPAAAAADDAAALDREAARIELADKFHVLADGEASDGVPNAIDPAEFEEMVALYSDIRRGQTDLSIDTSGMSPEEAAKFKGGAMQDLGTMMQTGSGRDLIRKLADNEKDHKTSIGPGTEAKASRPTSPDPEQDALLDRHDHDGTGNSGRVVYTPGAGDTEVGPDGDTHVKRSDITLFHELTHALHRTEGQKKGGIVSSTGPQQPVSPCDDTITQEEYQTVGLGREKGGYLTENTYRSERAELGEDVAQRQRYSTDGKQLAPLTPETCR